MEIGRRSTGSHSVERSPWNGVWTCSNRDYKWKKWKKINTLPCRQY